MSEENVVCSNLNSRIDLKCNRHPNLTKLLYKPRKQEMMPCFLIVMFPDSTSECGVKNTLHREEILLVCDTDG